MAEEQRKGLKYDFEGKVAIVTGGAGGLGRAIASAFARQGASVVIGDVNLEGAEETVQLITETGGVGISCKMDVANEKDVRKLLDYAVVHYGKLDFACNNAGIGTTKQPVVNLSKDRWDHELAINLTGVYLLMKYEMNQMLKQGSGSIVNISSVAGIFGSENMAGYVASKHGITGLTKTAAIEMAKKGIRVNAVAPGVINAGLTVTANKQFLEKAVDSIPIGRMGEAEEIASAVLWLCSDEASFVLGQTLPVDGGMTIS
jgi:NAD(P)-dependent dehydrogenase (short-subunit alcohol dehydrogenase family)